uniref:Protein kinase domain-containing protein n=1 Tax=Steinernema glaseri TaxID=37863 RepID=A0A1I7ZX82_9BILA
MEDLGKYETINKIGQGTFGEVFKAKCKVTGRIVALKKILTENEKEGFPITALREIRVLQRLKSDYVTELIDICAKKNGPQSKDRCTFYLVFTFCDHDLAGLLNSRVTISLQQKKTLLKHLFNGLFTIHLKGILHRDMKAANVLIGSDGYLKLADFGLARPLIRKKGDNAAVCYTNRVVTLWYRPPELLLGERNYGPAIDMWGAGCIMAEFWTRVAIMQGETEQKQLELITNLCGSVTKENWPKCDQLPYWGKLEFPQNIPNRIVERLSPKVNDTGALSLIQGLLELDPEKRLDAKAACIHDFFLRNPRPNENVKDLLATLTTSMFEYTHGRGAQVHHRPHHPPPQQQQKRTANDQYYDRCY